MISTKPSTITMTSWWARWRLKSPASRLFTQPFVQVQIKKTSKLRVTSLCEGNSPVTGEFPAQRASNGKCFHLMTSSCNKPCGCGIYCGVRTTLLWHRYWNGMEPVIVTWFQFGRHWSWTHWLVGDVVIIKQCNMRTCFVIWIDIVSFFCRILLPGEGYKPPLMACQDSLSAGAKP